MNDVYQKVRAYYDQGLWDKTRLGNMVIRDIITEEQYIAIVGSDPEYGGGVKGDLMLGATATEDGTAGLVPPPPKGTIKRYLGSDGIWCPPDGGNADTIDGFHASQTRDSANTCVVRDANGYTQLGYINSDTPDDENPSISQVIVTNGSDDYYRRASLGHLKTKLSVSNIYDNLFSNSTGTSSGFTKAFDIHTYDFSGFLITATLKTRGGYAERVSILFSEGSGDPGLARFDATPLYHPANSGSYGVGLDVYLVKVSTSLWSLYARTGNYGDLLVFGTPGHRNDAIVLPKSRITVSSLPAGHIAPTGAAYIP